MSNSTIQKNDFKATDLNLDGFHNDYKVADINLANLGEKNMSLNMKNILTHLHHPHSVKDYQGDEDPSAVKISEYWGKTPKQLKNPKISFEFFPPRSDAAKKSLKEVHRKLSSINPEYFSVTFGALGSSQNTTFDTITGLFRDTRIPITPHLTCVGTNKKQVTDLLDEYIIQGVNQVMVLKGDAPNTIVKKGDFEYANEMVKFIKENYENIDILVGAYPEKHPHSNCVGKDIDFFVNKVNAGATRAVTQYFYNIDAYFSFVDEVQKLGVDIPIIPGIMPITSYDNLINFSTNCGAEIPSWILNRLKLYRNDAESLEEFGEDVVSEMCLKLKAGGVKNFHFYSMNRVEPVLSIAKRIL
jgi:methylenetetrahydrofolate reductase (NADPH)